MRWLGGALLLAFVAGNLWQLGGLLRHGRGHYRELIRHIDDHDDAEHIVITGDQDFRHPLMLRFYARPPLTDAEIRYIGFYPLPPDGASWYILHLRAPWREAPSRITDRWDHPYDLAAAYRSDILSGYHLVLYQRVAHDAPSPPAPPQAPPRSPP